MKLLKNLVLKVELFDGADVHDAACDLCMLAKRVGVLVEADFNGVKLLARPDDSSVRLVRAYHEQLKNKCPVKIAQACDV